MAGVPEFLSSSTVNDDDDDDDESLLRWITEMEVTHIDWHSLVSGAAVALVQQINFLPLLLLLLLLWKFLHTQDSTVTDILLLLLLLPVYP